MVPAFCARGPASAGGCVTPVSASVSGGELLVHLHVDVFVFPLMDLTEV